MSRPVLCPSFAFFLWTLSLSCLDPCLVPTLSCVLFTPDSCPVSVLSKNDVLSRPCLVFLFIPGSYLVGIVSTLVSCLNIVLCSHSRLILCLTLVKTDPCLVPNLSCVFTPDWCSVSLLSRLTRALSQTCPVFLSTPAVGPVPVMSCALVHSSLVPCLSPVYIFAMSQPCLVFSTSDRLGLVL